MKPVPFAIALLLLLASTLGAEGNVSVADLPAVPVKTVPQSGDTSVDPTLTELRVTFSKDMMTDGWSWAEINSTTFPKVTGKAHFLTDKRTCVLPVHLEAGKTYAVWINSGPYDKFRDLGNKPAVPYLVVFQTKPYPETPG